MAITFDKQPASRFGATQLLQPSASSVSSSAFGAQTYQIRVAASATVNIKVGDGAQTATSADPLLPSTIVDYITVTPGQRIAAFGTANVTVTEVS
jgi:hypothetical protein